MSENGQLRIGNGIASDNPRDHVKSAYGIEVEPYSLCPAECHDAGAKVHSAGHLKVSRKCMDGERGSK